MNSVVSFRSVFFPFRPPSQEGLSLSHFELRPGEKVFLQGPSGTGKSTFLSLIAGVLTPTRGEIEILGEKWNHLSTLKRDQIRGERMGIIFQRFNLLPSLSVLENVILPAQLHRTRRNRVNGDLKEAGRSLLGKFGLGDFIEEKVTSLSVGQQQRVALCRALIGKPELLLADEPTSSLDEENAAYFMKTLFEYLKDQGAALIFVSHDTRLEKGFDRSLSLKELTR